MPVLETVRKIIYDSSILNNPERFWNNLAKVIKDGDVNDIKWVIDLIYRIIIGMVGKDKNDVLKQEVLKGLVEKNFQAIRQIYCKIKDDLTPYYANILLKIIYYLIRSDKKISIDTQTHIIHYVANSLSEEYKVLFIIIHNLYKDFKSYNDDIKRIYEDFADYLIISEDNPANKLDKLKEIYERIDKNSSYDPCNPSGS